MLAGFPVHSLLCNPEQLVKVADLKQAVVVHGGAGTPGFFPGGTSCAVCSAHTPRYSAASCIRMN